MNKGDVSFLGYIILKKEHYINQNQIFYQFVNLKLHTIWCSSFCRFFKSYLQRKKKGESIHNYTLHHIVNEEPRGQRA